MHNIIITPTTIAERAADLRAKAPARKTYTMPHPDKKGSDRVWQNCHRCGGSGRLPHYQYIEGGRCFTCEGTGGRKILVSSVRNRVRTEVKRHNEFVDTLTTNAEDTARLELQEEAAEAYLQAQHEAEEEARRKAAQIKQEQAEIAAEELADNFPAGTKITDLPVTLKETYTFYKDAWNSWEKPVLTVCAVFADTNGTELAWYSSGNKALKLHGNYDADAAPAEFTIRGTVKRHQERNDGTARVILTRATYRQQ